MVCDFYLSKVIILKKESQETPKWSGLCAFTAKDLGSIPGQRTKVSQSFQSNQKKRHSTSTHLLLLNCKKQICFFMDP